MSHRTRSTSLGGYPAGGGLRLGAHPAELARTWDVAHEAEAGEGLAAGHRRGAMLVDHAEVPHHGLQAGAVPGRGDHVVRLDAAAVAQRNALVLERLDGGHGQDPALSDRG